MSVSSDRFSSLARSKLSLSTSSSRDVSLHRWVLLKNSILHSPSLPNNPAEPSPQPEDSEEDEDVVLTGSLVDTNTFMFPDTGHLVDSDSDSDSDSFYYADSETRGSEAQWLDSLLETLGDDEDDDDYRVDSADSVSHPHEHHHTHEDDSISSLPVDDDDFTYSPTVSPMSSSDDLPSQPSYYSSPISVPYPVPYPPLVHAYHRHPFDSSFVSTSSHEDPLPYHDVDDLEDPPVPDAIEDTSDDESDAPTTPSLGRSNSSLSFGSASNSSPLTIPPTPTSERSRLCHSTPRVYIDSNDSYFYSFEVDPLPFPDDEHLNTSYNRYSAC